MASTHVSTFLDLGSAAVAAAAAAEGAKDTKPEEAERTTYNPAADFTMQVPANHRQLRELRELRDAAAAAAAAAQQQRLPGASQRSLFGSSSSRSSRGYHSSAHVEDENVLQLQELMTGCSLGAGSSSVQQQLQQRLLFSSSSSSSSVGRLLSSSSGVGSRSYHSSWCGVAAAPLLV
jgi:hypothetical protein